MTLLLQARSIAVSRGTTELFENLELAVSSGDRIGVVGHNGAGKSTLLNLLAGELATDKGDILRKRGLRLAVVEQFLPDSLHTVSIRSAVAERVAADEAWRADALLSELGFDSGSLERPAGEFSGGQQNRLMLARALVGEPELLLLDEPTNHLDLATLLLFESLLRDFAGGLVLVSHDRDFLDAVTNTTCVLRDARAYRFAMSYTPAMQALAEMDEANAKTRAAEERKIAALKHSAKRLATWGKVYDNEKFARRAKSMERRVERMEEDRTFVSSGSPLDLELQLGDTRAKQALIIENFDVQVPGRTLYSIDELIVRPGDRIALLGANGTGKSTLIRSIMHAYQRGGSEQGIRFSPQSVIGYYDQELDEVAGDESLLAFACARVEAAEQQVRTRLIRSGFSHGDHDKRVGQLSGGERARLLFLVHALNSPNFMILDEPTNHIDIAGKEQLEYELLASNATLLITSHDRRFLRRLANRFLWIRDGMLIEVPDAERFFGFSAPVDFTSTDTEAQSGRADSESFQPLVQSADQVLEQIVELERRLAEDEARKAKFRKPALQQRWRDELQVLYARLAELEAQEAGG